MPPKPTLAHFYGPPDNAGLASAMDDAARFIRKAGRPVVAMVTTPEAARWCVTVVFGDGTHTGATHS